MIGKTEQEIMENWKTSDQIMVNVACFAFNHEYGIGEALDSFLMQETTFPFQVLVNDDLSTDGTVNILQQYEKKFPNIIIPVYQSENQFSQGINPMSLLLPKLKGKYVALCEGDDYWTDSGKLQIQVDQLEKEEYADVDLCFHSAYLLLEKTRGEIISKHSESNKLFATKDIILGGGSFCPTASLLIKSRAILSLADWFDKAIPGDYITQILGAARGGALYIDQPMSIYRVGNEGSWTTYRSTEVSENRKKTLFANNDRLKLVSNTLDKKFQKEFDQVISKYNFDFIKRNSTDLSVRKDVYKVCKDDFSIKQKLLWFLLYRNTNLHNFLSLIKSKIFPATQ